MKLTINVPDNFVPELFHNLPEAAISFRCHGWDYDNCNFDLVDEEDKKYTLTRAKAENGFKKLMRKIFNGELRGLSISSSNFLDAGEWDSFAIDALLQCSLLGDVIYG